MKNVLKKQLKQLTAFILAASILFIIVHFFNKSKQAKLKECSRYSIGYITSARIKTVKYRYTFKGREYASSWAIKTRDFKESMNLYNYKHYENSKFLIRFQCNDPSVVEVVLGSNIPDSVSGIPHDGWPSIPRWFRKMEQ